MSLQHFKDLTRYAWHTPDVPTCDRYFDPVPGPRALKAWEHLSRQRCACGFYEALGRALAVEKKP